MSSQDAMHEAIGQGRPALTARPSAVRFRAAPVLARLRGPGGFYNAGNALALGAGLALQVHASLTAPAAPGLLAALGDHFAGSPAAATLSLAMAIFFCSGELYHRAWARGFPPDPRQNRQGDLVSALGAAALALALALLGQPVLAVTSGLLLVGGKLGSAWLPPGAAGLGRRDMLFRGAVLASRVPTLAAVAVELLRAALRLPEGGEPLDLAMPAAMAVSTLLWARADLFFFRSPRN